jgi:2-polyprenyl-3-methyl-5-hydroxy-6-metoxy-1,4-benzoquinol methylase
MLVTKEYAYSDAAPTWANHYLWPVLRGEIALIPTMPNRRRALDLGCGNGATSGMLAALGFDMTGIDTSESGITQARKAFPICRFEVGSAYDDLVGRFGRFQLVVSLEVVEHLFDPRKFAQNIHDVLEPGGTAVISTPYHGYLKNLALAVTGKMDGHFTALWDGGHIKFFSIRTLRTLLSEAGFRQIRFIRVGRVPPLAKSMVAVVRKDQDAAGSSTRPAKAPCV